MARKTRTTWQQRTYRPTLGDRYKPPPPSPRPGRPGMPPPPAPKRPGRPGIPETHVVTLGETYPDIADRYGVGVTDLMRGAENLTPIPGTAVDIPTYPETGLSVRPGYTPEPPPKVGLETAETTDIGLQYPTGWNPAQVLASTEYGVMDFYSKFYGGYYTEYGGLGAEAPRLPDIEERGRRTQQQVADAALYGTPTEMLPEIPGIPSYHAWTKDETTGAWERQPQEAVFDALYEMNGIDPTDPDAVQWFWSQADEDLLGVGILFDVIDWGDEGGYGYPAPPAYELGTPSRMYGRGQKPVRGEYASYLGLTSWSI